MTSEARRAATAAYKKRKVEAGIYAVRCEASGEVWVGAWADLATVQNRIWFALRQGAHPRRDVLDAWRRHGESRFSFEILETLEEEASPYVRAVQLKDRAQHWREKLAAKPI